MYLLVIGLVTVVYCGVWLLRGIRKQSVPDNLMRMIDADDERFTAMVISYGVGFAIGMGVIIIGLTKL